MERAVLDSPSGGSAASDDGGMESAQRCDAVLVQAEPEHSRQPAAAECPERPGSKRKWALQILGQACELVAHRSEERLRSTMGNVAEEVQSYVVE